jgi:predicted nucleic acid-binding protein
MPFVLVDTSVALPATLSSRGFTRKFFVILAYGAVTYEVEHRRLELEELTKEAGATGGTVDGIERVENRLALLDDRRAALEELLPYDTPNDWVAVGSPALFDEYERKLVEVGTKLNPALRSEDVPVLRRQFEALCVAASPPFEPSRSPGLTADPEDDPIVYGALLADADFVISDDRHIVPDRSEQFYEHEGRSLTAMTFARMIERFFVPENIDFDEIDGGWLAVAHSAVGGGSEVGDS